MSGFIVIANRDGEPCHTAALRELTRVLSSRGPDGTNWVTRGPIGLGATLFRTTDQAAHESQPLSFDGVVWIVGDVRLDDRANLLRQLRAAGRETCADDPDVNVVLHAWYAWGADCIMRLRGDFAFVVWDERHGELFAARDHFGVRPMYYAHNERVLCLSNTLGCLRRHQHVRNTLDESFIADFLLFGWAQTPTTTAFHEIRRLHSAHRLSFKHDALSVERYWNVPTFSEPLHFRDPREYAERFRDVMRLAVVDRLRAPVVGFELSGGTDSTCVAATACDLRRRGATAAELRAWTVGAGSLFPEDEEPRIAALAAASLGLRHRTLNWCEYLLFRERNGAVVTPGSEPSDLSLSAARVDSVNEIAAGGRVVLTGQGGDGILAASQLHVLRMLRQRHWVRATREVGQYTFQRRRLPPLGVRSSLKRRLGIKTPVPAFPGWIEPDLIRRFGLREKWSEVHQPPPVAGPEVRAEAAHNMRAPWATLFDGYDSEALRTAVEYRHPYFDLRVIEFLLQVPPLPWLANKELAREAWPDLLPERVRNRPKVPLRGDPLRARVQRGDDAPLEWRCHEIASFVRVESTPAFRACAASSASLYLAAGAVSLGLWLRERSGNDREPRETPQPCAAEAR
ncbi:MAG: asparagine synthetase B family protein [Longimicrobiales bacterium]